jgi:PKD repeat protein
VPLTVSFVDETEGTISQRSWNWGDGSGAYEAGSTANASHTYESVGSYSVSFTAVNCGGSNSITKTNYITVTEKTNSDVQAPVANLYFGSVDIGTSRTLLLGIVNNGNGSARVNYTTLMGNNWRNFTVKDDNLIVAADDTTNLEITFTPSTADSFAVVLQLDFGDRFFETTLQGHGVVPLPPPVLHITPPDTIQFGGTPPGLNEVTRVGNQQHGWTRPRGYAFHFRRWLRSCW